MEFNAGGIKPNLTVASYFAHCRISLVSIIAGLINLIPIEDIQSNQLISQPALMKQTSAMAYIVYSG